MHKADQACTRKYLESVELVLVDGVQQLCGPGEALNFIVDPWTDLQPGLHKFLQLQRLRILIDLCLHFLHLYIQ